MQHHTAQQPFWKLFRCWYFGHRAAEWGWAAPIWPNIGILHAAAVMEICEPILFFYRMRLLKFPRQSPEQSVWSQHMLLLLLRPPGRLSWENTEKGSGSLRPDLSLWTPAGLRGPSGFGHTVHQQGFRACSRKGRLVFSRLDMSTAGLFEPHLNTKIVS